MISQTSSRVIKTSALLLLLFAGTWPSPTTVAQELCSSEGKTRMRTAGVTDAQINKICPASTNQRTQVPIMGIDDLRLDFESLLGKRVAVKGAGLYMMDQFFIRKSPTDTSPIPVDIARIEREQRRQILQKCADMLVGCRATVVGVVSKVSFQNGIVAEGIELQ